MGYNTKFQGVLQFACRPTVEMIGELKKYLGEDIRDLEPDIEHEFYYIDMEITKDLNGLQWNGAEKTYGMCEQINWLVNKMRQTISYFNLIGQMEAQGEDMDDRWILVMRDGVAVKIDCKPAGEKVTCPNCKHEFYITKQE